MNEFPHSKTLRNNNLKKDYETLLINNHVMTVLSILVNHSKTHRLYHSEDDNDSSETPSLEGRDRVDSVQQEVLEPSLHSLRRGRLPPLHKAFHESLHEPLHKPLHKPLHEPLHKAFHKALHEALHKPHHEALHEAYHKTFHEALHKILHEATDGNLEQARLRFRRSCI